jgi:3-hydroxyisobutyrate dehydrogenase-like beta-hydroxyacid dehydrogenase
VSPGQLGAELGAQLVARGYEVVSPLRDRSERTRERARRAGILDGGSLAEVVETAPIVLSLVPPTDARATASACAAVFGASGSNPLYVDANSISPRSAAAVDATVSAAGARFVDAAVIAPTPRTVATTRIYAAGPGLADFLALAQDAGLVARPLGDVAGRASALKMAYSCLTKGLPALAAGSLVVAESAGLLDEFVSELEFSQPDMLEKLPASLARLPRASARWAGEADEIAQTFADSGLPSALFEGVAEIYRIAAESGIRAGPPASDAPAVDQMSDVARALVGELSG